ncbi:hypothetical protein SELMODRAFT_138994 [Selaginella moellendorffii]|uniref:CLASP N-terminal domain-containing protein n=1 Tax=Selaginella moellendorffii TaxID=88036 RepID=D8TGF6_SELML|nr:hypothetical protein SELMODRAFT_138994 [Selaginella moellendorffii]
MTTWIWPVSLIHKLQPYTTHRNPRVRAKLATCISKSVAKLGAEGIRDYGLEALMQIAAAQLIDQLPEARESARKLVVELHSAFQQQPDVSSNLSETSSSSSGSDSDDQNQKSWEEFCSSILTPAVAQPILRVSTR